MTLFDFSRQFLQFFTTENYISEIKNCDSWEELCCLVLISDSALFVKEKEREGWVLIDSQSFCITTNIRKTFLEKKKRREISDSVYIHSLRFIKKTI